MNLLSIRILLAASLFFIIESAAFAQVDVYYDIEGNIVNEKKYYSESDGYRLYPYEQVRNDTTYHTLLIREREGRLTEIENDSLWSILQRNDPKATEDLDFAIISYMHGINKCGGSWTIERYNNRLDHVKTELDKIGRSDIIYYHYGDAELKREKQKGHHSHDQDGYIANLFLAAQVNCSSYIVVNRNGFYQSFLGEMMLEHLIQMVFDLYSYDEEITMVGGHPVTITDIQYKSPSGDLMTKKKYNKAKKKGDLSESVQVIDNIKVFQLVE